MEKWKKSLDSQETCAALLIDLSKVFDCLNHDPLIAKLDAYGFDDSSLTFVSSYLKGRNQRTKVANSYSSWAEIVSRVHQGSVLYFVFYFFYFVVSKRCG